MKRKEIENRRSMPTKIITLLVNILQILSLGFLVYSIILISKIETKYMILATVLFVIVNIVSILFLRKLTKKNKLSKIVIFLVVSLLIIFAQSYLGYFVNRTYSSIDKVNKNKVTYETNIVVLKDSNILDIKDLKDTTIGIINDETSIDGYIMANEIIDDKKLENSNEIKEYSTISEMMKALYDKNIDAVITSSNYASMLRTIDTFVNIESDTKVIYKKEKTFTKKEIVEYTGEEIVNTNTSDKITEPFTILIMGIDSTNDTLDKNATGNGDALMLLTFNPKTLNATVWSVPRDTYTYITCLGKENKITHAGWGGESCMINTLQRFTGVNIDYYVKVNFKGVVKAVDALGGITVNIPEEMDGVCEQDSNRNFGNLQCFKKGEMKLNGEQALALARHRKTLALGDFQRGLNQQLVVQGMLNKLKTIRSTTKALELLETVSNSMDTNLTTSQLLSFYDIAKNIFTTSSNSDNIINLQQLYLMGQGQMIYDESIGLELYNFIPNESSLDQIVSIMKQNLGLEKIKEQVKTMDFNIEEMFEMEILGTDNLSSTSTYTLLPSVVGKNVEQAKATLQALGLSVTVEEKEFEISSGYSDGQVLEQSYPAGKRVDLISGSIKLVVAKLPTSNTNSTDDGDSEIIVSANIANSEVINYTGNNETYSETDRDTITASLNGEDITNDIIVNVTYSDDSLLTATPQTGQYTVTYKITYQGKDIKTYTKSVTVN